MKSRFPAPDFSGRFRWGGDRGYIQVAGLLPYGSGMSTAPTATRDLSGDAVGWGFNISSTIPVGAKDALKLSTVYGHGVENYMNDAPVDIAPVATLTNTRRPVDGEALPVFSINSFYDHYWNSKFTTSIGYSMITISNTALQVASEFHRGQYGLTNLLYNPVKNVMVGGEFQWGRRDNFTDGFVANDYRIQCSFKYIFDYKLGSAK